MPNYKLRLGLYVQQNEGKEFWVIEQAALIQTVGAGKALMFNVSTCKNLPAMKQ